MAIPRTKKSLSTSSDNYVSGDLYFPILSVPLFVYPASAVLARQIAFCFGLSTVHPVPGLSSTCYCLAGLI